MSSRARKANGSVGKYKRVDLAVDAKGNGSGFKFRVVV